MEIEHKAKLTEQELHRAIIEYLDGEGVSVADVITLIFKNGASTETILFTDVEVIWIEEVK